MKKVVVIGAGASGMVAAIEASKNCEVIILEKNKNVGKKILITGNGKCNYFNEDFTDNHYNSSSKELLNEIITPENKQKILNFFDKLGVIPKIKNGYYYPYSNQAKSIQNILLTELKSRKIKIVTEEIVENIKYSNNQFIIKTNLNNYKADNVILATGSKACYDTIYDDIGYNIAKSFGHKIIPVLPGLVQLKGEENYFKDWNGIRSDAKVSLYIDNKLVKEEVGEIQLTNYGISGICTMQLSNYAVSGISQNKDVSININFLDFLNISNASEFLEFIKERSDKLLNRTISELFDGVINYKLANLFFKLTKIKLDAKVKELNNDQLLKLGECFTAFNLKITGYNSFKEAQICLGGVSLNEVNPKTFESFKQKGLYIVGELLDVNGDCGGYNLGFAWLSGILAGEHLGGNHD